MKPELSLLIAALFLILSAVAQAMDSSDQVIRVRLFQNAETLEIFGMNLRVDQIPLGHTRAMPIAIPQSRFERMKIQVSQVQGRPHFLVESMSAGVKKTKVIASDNFQVQGQFMTALGRELPSRLHVQRQKSKLLDVVAEIDFETYLVGVLSSEMPTSWPLEALKAQAVAARSYTLAVLEEKRGQHFDLESSVMDQVFKYPRNLSPEAREKVQSAVQQTAGVVLKDENGRALKAFYHADCGGQTKSPRQVWGQGTEVWSTTQDHSCPRSPKARWSLRLSAQKLQKKLNFNGFEITQIRGPFQQNGKDYVHIWTSQGQKISMLANEFRSKVGFDLLKSTRFKVQKMKEVFIFEGQGHGHAVGLCQWGTRMHAERGQTYSQILSHYYKSAKLMYTVSQNEKPSY